MPIPDQLVIADAATDRKPRQSRLIKAALDCDRFGRFDVTLRNVSQTGIGGHGAHILTPGERLTVHLPGHATMRGTVRWVADQRFGIETDREIEIHHLRVVLGCNLPSADNSIEFRIIPPPKLVARRPGLTLGAAKPRDDRTSSWTDN